MRMRMLAMTVGAALLAIGHPAGDAHAQRAPEWEFCDTKELGTPDVRIRNCTALIESRRESAIDRSVAYSNRGMVYRGKGDNDRALADYNEAIKLDPNNAKAYNNRGNLYDDRGDRDRAIADFNQAIKLDPTFAVAYNNRGTAYSNKGDNERALADYNAAIRIDPKYAEPVANRGGVYLDKHDYARAIAEFTLAIRVDPKFANAYNGRCLARALVGRELREALADCDESLRLGPTPDIYNTRGFVQLKLGAFARAIADYSAAIEKKPKDADSLYGRGLAKLKSGDKRGGDADIAAAKAIKADIAEEYAGNGVK